MGELAYRSYFFSSQEFMVLSACSGMEGMHILFEEPPAKLSREELNVILFGLYQRGILYWKDESSYALKPEIRMMFEDMKSSKKELQIYFEKGGSPLLCFWNAHTVITELSENDKNTIKIHSLSEHDFFRELCDRGILPARDSQEIGDFTGIGVWQKRLQLVQDGSIRYEALQRLLHEEDGLPAYMTVYDRKSGRDQGVILILDCGISDGMAFVEDNSVQTLWYSLDNLKKLLML